MAVHYARVRDVLSLTGASILIGVLSRSAVLSVLSDRSLKIIKYILLKILSV